MCDKHVCEGIQHSSCCGGYQPRMIACANKASHPGDTRHDQSGVPARRWTGPLSTMKIGLFSFFPKRGFQALKSAALHVKGTAENATLEPNPSGVSKCVFDWISVKVPGMALVSTRRDMLHPRLDFCNCDQPFLIATG